jgi:hypothetical protein
MTRTASNACNQRESTLIVLALIQTLGILSRNLVHACAICLSLPAVAVRAMGILAMTTSGLSRQKIDWVKRASGAFIRGARLAWLPAVRLQ